MKKISTTTTTNNFGGKKLANYFIRLCGCFYLKKFKLTNIGKLARKKSRQIVFIFLI
jgi:hypothetical protein